MSQTIDFARPLSRVPRVLPLLAGLVLVGGLASCNNSNNGDSQPTLTLTPASISLTAGATGQQASLMLAAPAGNAAATVTVSGLPTGVTISPSALSLTPGVALPLVILSLIHI